MESELGSTRTRSKRVVARPSESSDSRTVATGASLRSAGSVKTRTWRAPSSERSAPHSRVAPAPKRIAEVANSKANSEDEDMVREAQDKSESILYGGLYAQVRRRGTGSRR